AEDVEHVVEPGRLAAQPLRGAQRADRVSHPALRAHRDFDPLAETREKHRVLADDVAAANRVEGDLLGGTLAGLAFAPMAGDLAKLAAECLCDDFAKLERRARWRIDLVAM